MQTFRKLPTTVPRTNRYPRQTHIGRPNAVKGTSSPPRTHRLLAPNRSAWLRPGFPTKRKRHGRPVGQQSECLPGLEKVRPSELSALPCLNKSVRGIPAAVRFRHDHPSMSDWGDARRSSRLRKAAARSCRPKLSTRRPGLRF